MRKILCRPQSATYVVVVRVGTVYVIYIIYIIYVFIVGKARVRSNRRRQGPLLNDTIYS